MTNYSKLYWFTRLDSVHDFLMVIIVISSISIFIYCLFYLFNAMDDGIDGDDINTYVKKFGRTKTIALIFGIIALSLISFIPTKNEMIFIYAGGKTMNFVEKDTSLNKIPAQTTKLITDYLEKQLKDDKK